MIAPEVATTLRDGGVILCLLAALYAIWRGEVLLKREALQYETRITDERAENARLTAELDHYRQIASQAIGALERLSKLSEQFAVKAVRSGAARAITPEETP